MSKNGLARVLMTCLCALSLLISYAQGKRVSGTITDDKAVPLVGATVTVKGTNVITSTNSAGAFTIDVPAGGTTLVVSYVGMTNQEIIIGDRSNVSAKLVPTNSTLTDVVVIGYGTNICWYKRN
jgi:iron complex outermembrane receptor protein